MKPRRRRRTISIQDITSLQDGEDLYEAVGDDPAYLEVSFHLEKPKEILIGVFNLGAVVNIFQGSFD